MISIIVPIYNAEQWLEKCLNSLLVQTYRNIEVICVDDGSQDKSASLLADYSIKDCRIKVIRQHNEGLSSARNRGMKEAQGEWLMFVDSDDWIDTTTCEKAVKLALSHKLDVVLWSYIREFSDGEKKSRPLMDGDKLFDEDNIHSLHRLMIGPVGKELSDPTLLHSWGTVWGKLYSRRVIGQTEFVDTNIISSAEDGLFNIEVFTRVKRAFYLNEAMYHYRKGEKKSLTGRYSPHLNEGWQNLYTIIADVITSHNLPSDFYKALNSRIVLGLIGQGLNECKSPRNRQGKIDAIKQIITQYTYTQAICDLPLRYLPLQWRIFFDAAKKGRAEILYILLLIIKKLR